MSNAGSRPFVCCAETLLIVMSSISSLCIVSISELQLELHRASCQRERKPGGKPNHRPLTTEVLRTYYE
jgi:hypothetical protein